MTGPEPVWSAQHTAGPWIAAAGPAAWLLADLDPAGPVLAACWQRLRAGQGADAVLGALVDEGLRAVGSFALFGTVSGTPQVLLRGVARAHLVGPSGAHTVDAGGASTWAAYPVEPGTGDVTLIGTGDLGGAPLPLLAGLAWAGTLRVAAQAAGAADTDSAGTEPAAHPAYPAAAPVAQPPAGAQVIDSIPWAAPGTPAPVGYDAPPAVGYAPPTVGYDAPASVGYEAAPAGYDAPAATWDQQASYDQATPDAEELVGQTVQRHDLQAEAVVGPNVLAVLCPAGHLSPPYAGGCRVCGAPIAAQEPFNANRPLLGLLSLSTGDTVTLDRDVMMGRAPNPWTGDPADRPHIVRLASPNSDISRTHLQVRLDGWHVLVTDLGSTNGTVALMPGEAPVRLRPNDPLSIPPGTVVTIADEISFRYDVMA